MGTVGTPINGVRSLSLELRSLEEARLAHFFSRKKGDVHCDAASPQPPATPSRPASSLQQREAYQTDLGGSTPFAGA